MAAGKDVIRALPNGVAGDRRCFAALIATGRVEETKYHADVICDRLTKDLAFPRAVR